MPYITESDRARIAALVPDQVHLLSDGELNFFLTKICLARHPASYAEYMKLIGTLECVKLELYRRAVAPYEDHKKELNGDVY